MGPRAGNTEKSPFLSMFGRSGFCGRQSSRRYRNELKPTDIEVFSVLFPCWP